MINVIVKNINNLNLILENFIIIFQFKNRTIIILLTAYINLSTHILFYITNLILH